MPRKSSAKPETGMYLRIPTLKMRDDFREYANANSRSMNGQLIEMMRSALAKFKKEKVE